MRYSMTTGSVVGDNHSMLPLFIVERLHPSRYSVDKPKHHSAQLHGQNRSIKTVHFCAVSRESARPSMQRYQ